jgi:hypothetical protein
MAFDMYPLHRVLAIAVDYGIRDGLSRGYFNSNVTSILVAEFVGERLKELHELIHKRRNICDPAR